MNLEIQHIEIHVSALEKAKEFYCTKLGLEILDEIPQLKLLSLKAGAVRISIFGGYENNPYAGQKTGTHLIFRTDKLEATISELEHRGVQFIGGISEAPAFLRCIATADPDGNIIEIAEYLRDPLNKAN